jgi:hypothetical protein
MSCRATKTIGRRCSARASGRSGSASRIEALGATRLWVSEDPEDPFVVLADPEGNEFCVVRIPSWGRAEANRR